VLYMPRGFVHEAVAGDSLSIHVTLSTAQYWSGALLLHHMLGALDSTALPLPLRHSLPPAFLYNFGACQLASVTRAGPLFGSHPTPNPASQPSSPVLLITFGACQLASVTPTGPLLGPFQLLTLPRSLPPALLHRSKPAGRPRRR
jgi:Cupin superfamily protein